MTYKGLQGIDESSFKYVIVNKYYYYYYYYYYSLIQYFYFTNSWYI